STSRSRTSRRPRLRDRLGPCLPRRSAEALVLRVAQAGHEVIVHHPDGLHEGVTDVRSDEAEAPLYERRAHRVRLPGAGGKVAHRAPPALLRRSAHKAPEKVAKRGAALLELEELAGVADRGIHLLASADDPG